MEDGGDFCRFFGITEKGNFEGKSIPNLLGHKNQKDKPMKQLCEKLRIYRLSRTPLHRDEKILTSWNSLMIAALAKASFLCEEPLWLGTAVSGNTSDKLLQPSVYPIPGRRVCRKRQPGRLCILCLGTAGIVPSDMECRLS